MAHKDNLFVAAILAVIGAPFLLAGSIIAIWVPIRAANRVNVLENLPVSTVESLPAVNSEIVVEGTIVDRSEPVVQDLVIVNTYRLTVDDGEREWSLSSSNTPKFWVAVPGGLIKVNENYRVEQAAKIIEVADDLRHEGFRVKDAVLIVGTLVDNDDPPTIAAEVVSGETKAAFVERLRSERWFFMWFGAIFLVVGLFLLGGAAFVLIEPGAMGKDGAS